MKSRFVKTGVIAKYAVTGKKKQLLKLETVLKAAGYSGVISNETARNSPHHKWIILYHNTETGDKQYAYRTHNGSQSSNRPPQVLSIKELEKLLT